MIRNLILAGLALVFSSTGLAKNDQSSTEGNQEDKTEPRNKSIASCPKN
jgi:hypothetical protein